MLGFSHSYHSAITDESGPGEARRMVAQICKQLGFDDSIRSNAEIITTELATNIFKHAGAGEILAQRSLNFEGEQILEILALDKGPGIANFKQSFNDGFSTAGTQGDGLGAVLRLASSIDFYSIPGKGTALLATVEARKEPGRATAVLGTPPEPFDIGGINVPVSGEIVCGDDWIWKRIEDGVEVLVTDGLGHGADANAASSAASEYFWSTEENFPIAMLEGIHRRLRATRGAAASMVSIIPHSHEMIFAGVGNVSAVLVNDGDEKRLVTYNGTLGHAFRTLQEFTHPWTRESLLVIHSDGVNTHWNLHDYPGLSFHAASLIAAVLYRDNSRGRDDSTVVVVKQPPVDSAGA